MLPFVLLQTCFCIEPGSQIVSSRHHLHEYQSQESGIDVAITAGVFDSHQYNENTDENYQVIVQLLVIACSRRDNVFHRVYFFKIIFDQFSCNAEHVKLLYHAIRV